MRFTHSGNHLIARFTRYVCAVVQNARSDHLRLLRGYKRNFFSFPIAYEGSESFDEIYSEHRPVRHDFEFDDQFHEASYGMLGEKSRQVLRYTFVFGLSEDEIALLLDCKKESVKKLRYRAIRRLRELIERGEIEP